MENQNLVPCRRCTKEFNYEQNNSGNARQLCKECRIIVDNNELNKLEERTIVEGNRYLVGAPGRKDKYDPTDILIDGNIPEFESDADRFICAVEIGKFIRSNGFSGMEKNIVNLLSILGPVHRILFIKQLSLQQASLMYENENFKNLVREMIGYITKQ